MCPWPLHRVSCEAMASKDRDQRRAKRLARKRKQRAHASRPARDGQSGSAATPSLKAALSWPTGDCLATEGYDAPGAELVAVFTRSHADGRSVAAFLTIDRSGPGLTEVRILAVPAVGAVLAECSRISEAGGRPFQGVPPELVAGLVADAREHGSAPTPQGWDKAASLLQGVEHYPPDAPFGPAPPTEERPPGWLDRLFQLLG